MGTKNVLKIIPSVFHEEISTHVKKIADMGHKEILTLVKEHRELDAEIDSFQHAPNIKELKLKRLKKKQGIREMIQEHLAIAV